MDSYTYFHGGDVYSDNIRLDFSVNLNPYGMPEEIKKAVINGMNEWEIYPDYCQRRLKAALSVMEGVEPDNIICGNGASELIYDLTRAVKPARALLAVPTFTEYERALNAAGCETDYYMLHKENGYRLGADNVYEDYLKKLEDGYDMTFICNPNNPTGERLNYELIYKIAEKCRELHTFLVIDECFIDFVNAVSFAADTKDFKNVFVIKAFTKSFSMAGIRLGYGICSNMAVLERIIEARQCWNVSSIAIAAGLKAVEMKENGSLFNLAKDIEKYRKNLVSQLIKLGLNVVGGEGNFILFEGIMGLKEKLLKKGILIRGCGDFKGLDNTYYRVCVRTPKENDVLVDAISDILREV